MADTAVQRFYRYHAHIYDWTRWLFLHGRRRAVEALALRPDSVVLEVGCGTGMNFGRILAHLDPQHGRLVGLDFSEHMLRQARARIHRRGWRNVQLIHGDASGTRLEDTFDGILFAYSLSMIPDGEEALARAHQHLRPGGWLVVLDFANFDGWGPLRTGIIRWLHLHQVRTVVPYLQKLGELFPAFRVRRHLGGYYLILGARLERKQSRQ